MTTSPKDANVMGSLTQKITQIMTAPDDTGTGATPNKSFLAFCAPGVAVGRNELVFGDMTTKDNVNANSDFSQLVNNIPNSKGFWGLTGKKVWDIYQDSITQIELPETTLTQQQQTTLKKAQDFLFQSVTRTDPFTDEKKTTIEDSTPYASYNAYMTKYQSALKTYNGLLIQANAPGASSTLVQEWMRNGATYKQQVIAAYGEWTSKGYKQYVEEALGIIANLTGQGPAALYQSMRANFNADRLTDTLGSQFYPTYVYPKDPLNPVFDASWMTFEFNLEDVNSFQSDSETNSGGSASGGWGLWSASASAQYSSQQSNYECDTSNMSVSVQLLQLPLSRPWLRPEIYWSRGWRWAHSAGLGLISDGNLPPQGLMPLYPTAMVVARNLKISMDMSNTKNSSSFSKISTSASFGWGPFSISGNYSHSQSQSSKSYTHSNSGIQVPGTQIIAFVCEVLPLSPNPELTLPWPKSVSAEELVHK